VSFLLQNRFDAPGWGAVMNLMQNNVVDRLCARRKNSRSRHSCVQGRIGGIFGARPRPGNSPLNYKLLPRPTGEAAQIVVTEYDLPRADMPDGWTMKHNGTDWSEGTPSRYDGRAAHDVAVDKVDSLVR